ncbi:MAG TPA: BadF/BadG/BcrA/BcrD ATPase family protein [Pirellulaceae bacterium]|nr:BadF/BadG/BcrA/BcrD ATPase family protein [Pirellulaceae bacterium]
MKHNDLVLGVDGGGTKTIAWLAPREAPREESVLGRGNAGPSNMRSVGFETAIRNVDRAIQLAFDEAQLDRRAVSSICLGLAGADRDAERVPLRQWAESERLADRVIVTNDAIPLIYAGFADGVGVAIISGTGSVVFGRNQAGQVARCGGWGHLFGDEGSGYVIALDGLRAVARATDHRGPETTLLPRFLQAFHVPNANELIPAIYSPNINRAQIATYADLVFAAAEAGDMVAGSILMDAADRLAEMVSSVSIQLGFTGSPIPLAVTGGVLLNQEAYRTLLLSALAIHKIDVGLVKLVQSAVAGAVLMAASC